MNKTRWLPGLIFSFLLWVSLAPLAVGLLGNPVQKPFKVLPWAMSLEPFNHFWPHLMGKALREKGELEKGGRYFIKAVKLNPLDSDVWASLADLYGDEGRKEEAFWALRNAAFLEPYDASVQWGVMVRLLALDVPCAGPLLQDLISRLLLLDPSNRRNLFALAKAVVGESTIGRLLPSNEGVWSSYLFWLISKGKVDRALVVWRDMGRWGWRNERLFRRVVDGFLSKKAYVLARDVWLEEFPKDGIVHNGGFERDILGYGFGWRFYSRIKGLKSWGYSSTDRIEGRRSFFLEFDGEHNPGVAWPRQVVYLCVPGVYRLSAYMKSEGVTGATGFRLALWGKGVRASTKELRGYTPWRFLQVEFRVARPGPLWIALMRPPSRKLNRFLGGKVWLDQVVLEKVDEEGVSKGNT